MPTNTAAWLETRQARPEVRTAAYTPPRENEIVVKNHAVAINPIDRLIPVVGNLAFSWIKYPFVLGSDLTGEVAEVSGAVTRFNVGTVFSLSPWEQTKTATLRRRVPSRDIPSPSSGWPRPSPTPCLTKTPRFSPSPCLPLRVAFFRKISWRSTIRPQTQSLRGRRCSSGAVRRASAATRSNSPSPPATRSSPRRRLKISTTFTNSVQAKPSTTTARRS